MIISLGYVLINNKYSYIKSQIVFKAEFLCYDLFAICSYLLYP
jgi:hypothetical protein